MWLLIGQLLEDPRSRLHAVVNGWSHPVTWAGMAAMDLYDLTAARYMRREAYRAYPRPWAKSVRVARPRKRTVAEVYARLRPGVTPPS